MDIVGGICMIKREILILGLLALVLAQIHSGTFFEDEKRTSDPYIAEFGGFRSIFINPAGIAGQSGFDLAVNVGAEGSLSELEAIMATADLSTAFRNSDDYESYAASDQTQIASVFENTAKIIKNKKINERTILEAVFGNAENNRKGKSSNSDILRLLYGDDNTLDVDLDDEDAVRNIIDQLNDKDCDHIKTNVNNILAGENSRFYQGVPHQMSTKLLATVRAGFLLKGFGLGIYSHIMGTLLLDPDRQELSVDSVFNEFGTIIGYGFTIPDTSISLGFSSNFGTLVGNEDSVSLNELSTLFDQGIRYGYIWGIDAGVVWRPIPMLSLGIVFNDIVGSNQIDTPYYAEGLNGLFSNGNVYTDYNYEYEFSFDMDIGVALLFESGKVKSQFSLDFYDFIDFLRKAESNGDSFQDIMYSALGHFRIGANWTLFKVLKLAAQYHNNYVGIGMGLDLLFFELYGEAKIHDSIDLSRYDEDIPIKLDVMARIHF